MSVGKFVCRKICSSENVVVGKCGCRKICRRKICFGKFAVGKIVSENLPSEKLLPEKPPRPHGKLDVLICRTINGRINKINVQRERERFGGSLQEIQREEGSIRINRRFNRTNIQRNVTGDSIGRRFKEILNESQGNFVPLFTDSFVPVQNSICLNLLHILTFSLV